jgi:dihydrofolate reductase
MSNNKVIVVAFTTLDGVVEDPDGSWGAPFGGWGLRQGPQVFAGDKFGLGDILQSGALLFGRSTWQLFADRWPGRSDEFADAMNRARKYVVSRTLASADAWSNSILLDTDLTVGVERLRTERDVVVIGSTDVVHQLAAKDLVDEYRLLVLPTVLGNGERLFDATPTELHLLSADVTDVGVLLRYEVDRSPERVAG